MCGNTVLNEGLQYFELYEGARYQQVKQNSKYFVQAQCNLKRVTTKEVESLIYYSELQVETFRNGDVPDSRRQEDSSNLSINPHDIISDWPLFEAQSSSNESEPEHTINFINEYIEQPEEFVEDESLMYSRLCYAALALHSSKEWSDFSSFSADFRKGIHVKRIAEASGTTDDELKASQAGLDRKPTNIFPEIVTDLLGRKDFGVGEYVGIDQIALTSMKTAAQFCMANDFTWDGVISDRSNIRDFIAENAGFALLDFTIIGGKFGLVPSVPYFTSSNSGSDDDNAAGHINHAAKPGDPTVVRSAHSSPTGIPKVLRSRSCRLKSGRCLPLKCFTARKPRTVFQRLKL